MLVYYVTMSVYLVPSRERTPVTHGIEFIETTMFTRQIKLIAKDNLSDAERSELKKLTKLLKDEV